MRGYGMDYKITHYLGFIKERDQVKFTTKMFDNKEDAQSWVDFIFKSRFGKLTPKEQALIRKEFVRVFPVAYTDKVLKEVKNDEE